MTELDRRRGDARDRIYADGTERGALLSIAISLLSIEEHLHALVEVKVHEHQEGPHDHRVEAETTEIMRRLDEGKISRTDALAALGLTDSDLPDMAEGNIVQAAVDKNDALEGSGLSVTRYEVDEI